MERSVYVDVKPDVEEAYALEEFIEGVEKMESRFVIRNTVTDNVYVMTLELTEFWALRTMFIFDCPDR